MNVGDYVRTKNLGIFKIDEFCSDIEYDYIRNDKKGILINKKEIVKSSPNIIDLIEVEDYVNGKEVTNYYYVGEQKVLCLNYAEPYEESDDIVSNLGIKTIVTKEQFKSMEYEVNI